MTPPRPARLSVAQRHALERIDERGAIVGASEIRVASSTLRSLVRRGLVEIDNAADDVDGLERWYLLSDAGRRAMVGLT
jgi:hypothetical protein